MKLIKYNSSRIIGVAIYVYSFALQIHQPSIHSHADRSR